MTIKRIDRFWRVLFVIALVAFAVRITYVMVGKSGECIVSAPESGEIISSPTECIGGEQGRANDAVYYNGAANNLARGGGLTDPFITNQPAADHPPLTVFALAPISWIGDHVVPAAILDDLTNALLHRLTMAMIGVGVVVGIGVVGRRLGGERVGFIAASIAAVYPGLWISDGLIFSETVASFMVVLAIGAAIAARANPTPRNLFLVGVAVSLCALARAELLLLAPIFALVFVRLREPNWPRRLAVLIAGLAILLGPWIIYNNLRFDEFTAISTNDGLALAASNCEDVYYGSGIGLTSYDAGIGFGSCVELLSPRTDPTKVDQSTVSRIYRDRAFSVISEHMRRQPAVVAARIGRVWNLYRPLDMLQFNEGEDREPWATRAAMLSFFPIAAAAAIGAIGLLKSRRHDMWILVAPVVVVSIGAALTYGQARFRGPAEASLVLLGAMCIDRNLVGEPLRSRISSGANLSSRISALDGLRGIAVALVLLYHISLSAPVGSMPSVSHLLYQARAGVWLFFVLSGYLIFGPFAKALTNRSSTDIRRYALKRATRIFPAYLVALVILSIGFGYPATGGPDGWLRSLTLTQTFTSDAYNNRLGLGQAWSIAIEMNFYVFVPLFAGLVAWLSRRSGRDPIKCAWWGIGAMVACGYVWQITANGNVVRLYMLPNYFPAFGAGMALALLAVRTPPWFRSVVKFVGRWRIAVVTGALGVLALRAWVFTQPEGNASLQGFVGQFWFTLFAVPVVAAVVWSLDRPGVLSSRWIAALGIVSYGVFLWHLAIVERWRPSTFGLAETLNHNVIVYAIVFFPVCIAAGAASWFLIERPLLDRVHNMPGGQEKVASQVR